MIRRSQYRCSFKLMGGDMPLDNILDRCRQELSELISNGRLCNASFYRYNDMGFLYLEEIIENADEKNIDVDALMADLKPYLKPWPEENGDRFFAPMINVYYHHMPEDDLDKWEHERTTSSKQRIGRIAFVYPHKLPSYIMYHNAIVEEGLLKGDKYAFISVHENILFSYYEEPRNNVNIKNSDEESKVIDKWLSVDPESHFDRIKAEGSNFLVIPCLFSVDRIDLLQ